MEVTLLGVRFRDGKDRDGNPKRYYNADLYTDGGAGNVGIDEETYQKLQGVRMGTQVRVLPRWNVFNGRAEIRVADLEPVKAS